MTLVIRHGLLGSPRNWRSVTKDLQERHDRRLKFHMSVLRNHNGGKRKKEMRLKDLADDLAQELNNEVTGDCVLMGSSYGGSSIMRYLISAQQKKTLPKNLKGAIIVDVAPSSHRPLAMPDLSVELGAILNLDWSRRPSLKEANQQLQKVISNAQQRGFLLSNVDFRTGTFRTDLQKIYDNLKELNWDLKNEEAIFQTSDFPVTFIFGENSPYKTDASAQESVSRVFPHAEQHTIADAGHWVHVQQKERFVHLVSEKLSQMDF
jgi:pimeloyl-ACP methyl ester carboxylesterase